MNASSDDYEQADIYRDLRARVLSLNAETLEPRDGMFALLMETGYEEAAVTVVATADGSTSVYFSNGGGIIGAGEYLEVRKVALETLSETQRFTDQLSLTDTFPLPESGWTRFYLVTDQGVLTAEALEEDLGNERHGLSPLFYQVQKLITYIRRADEQRAREASD